MRDFCKYEENFKLNTKGIRWEDEKLIPGFGMSGVEGSQSMHI